jgi:hypothetical protein
MDNNFIIVINDSDPQKWPKALWNDFLEDGVRASIFYNPVNLNCKFDKKMFHLHFSNSCNSIFWLPFKSVWTKKISFQNSFSDCKRNFLIFQSNVKVPPLYLKEMKKNYDLKIILYFPDTIEKLTKCRNKRELVRYFQYYSIDKAFSFDIEDCKKYGLSFFDLYSDSYSSNITPFYEKSDIFYAGNMRNKERYQILSKISQMPIISDFYLSNVPQCKISKKNSSIPIKFNQYLSYPEVISHVLSSNCLLELVNPGQVGNTLRFNEAVVNKKLLLTNNPNVLHQKYYNSDYIFYFSKIEDININWIVKRRKIDYNYKGDFSGFQLITKILDSFDNSLLL